MKKKILKKKSKQLLIQQQLLGFSLDYQWQIKPKMEKQILNGTENPM